MKVELGSIGIAAAGLALLCVGRPEVHPRHCSGLNAQQIAEASALYLERSPRVVRYESSSDRWSATDGASTVWLDARSGQLLEVDFEPAGALRSTSVVSPGG